MTLKSRIDKLIEKANPTPAPEIVLYFHDENGYSLKYGTAPFYPTLEALCAAQGEPAGGRVIEVKYVDRVNVFIPDNNRESE